MTLSTTEPRGLRNNNPGNLRKSDDSWSGLAPVQDDPAFLQFSEPYFGIRALARTLLNYQRRHGLETIRALIARWAPPVGEKGAEENDTAAYVAAVARRTGFAPDQVLDLDDAATLAALVRAIILQENGEDPYDAALVERAVASALA
jgi:hypothetical protein